MEDIGLRKLYCGMRIRKFLKLTDLILIFSITSVLILCAFVFAPKGQGGQVEIYRGTKLIYIMPLNKDSEYIYKHEDHYNKITVKGGKVFISESDCLDKLCLKFAPTNVTGAFMACLPHEMFVIVKGTEEVVDDFL